MNVILNPDRTRKNVVSVPEEEARAVNSVIDINQDDIFITDAQPIPDNLHTPKLLEDNLTWVEGDLTAAANMEKEKARRELKQGRNTELDRITHDFGDGRIVQVRPQDVANFQLAISLGVSQEWVMSDNTIATLTPIELQTALDSGIAQGKVIWQTYIDSLKLL